LVFGLVALAAIEACGSRSPLLESFEEGVAGNGGSGASGGGIGGVGTGGVGGSGMGYGGSNQTGGVGGAYPGVGGAYPMGGVGAYPSAGYGGVGVSTGGAYPTGAGGAYPSAGYGGSGVAGAFSTGGTGGKGMGTAGKGGGGKGDARVYKGCLATCQTYDSYCAGPNSTCLADCLAGGALYPNCSSEFSDYLFCLNQEFRPPGECNPEDCSGPGCLTEAQRLCEPTLGGFTSCVEGRSACATVAEIRLETCRLTTYCGPEVYTTYCQALDATRTVFTCSCSSADTGASGTFTDRTVNDVCDEMAEACLPPLR
jgi:hypothetical protein